MKFRRRTVSSIRHASADNYLWREQNGHLLFKHGDPAPPDFNLSCSRALCSHIAQFNLTGYKKSELIQSLHSREDY
jgi:hypothetical protein